MLRPLKTTPGGPLWDVARCRCKMVMPNTGAALTGPDGGGMSVGTDCLAAAAGTVVRMTLTLGRAPPAATGI